MKTKHFLITTEDKSPVAVINCDSKEELVRKTYKCVREQLDDTCIGSVISHTWHDVSVSEYRFDVLKSIDNGIISAKRVELY